MCYGRVNGFAAKSSILHNERASEYGGFSYVMPLHVFAPKPAVPRTLAHETVRTSYKTAAYKVSRQQAKTCPTPAIQAERQLTG